MHSEMREKIAHAIGERVFPGCVVGTVNKGGEREVLPFGRFTYEADSPDVRADTVYDLASVTKSIPVASLALTLMGEGILRPDDLVRGHLPEVRNDHGATIEDLLTYRVKGPRFSALASKTPEAFTRYVLERGFDGPPGESVYSNMPAFLLGMVVERVSGEPLERLASSRFFGPFGMRDTSFFPVDVSRIPPTEVVQGNEVRGIVHDESARVFSRARRAVGHAGLFSTAPDLLAFLERLLQGDMPAVLEGAQKGWGWQSSGTFLGREVRPGAFGKTGFTGTSVSVDVARGIALVILANRTYPMRPLDAASPHSAMNGFRADISDLVFIE